MDRLYDVAISFLSRDESLAVKIYDELIENLRIFVYSKRQEELAGTDGLEFLRKAFFSDTALVVVLYRDGWGKSRWTAVEELAIKDRLFNGDWQSLLFVMLDDSSSPPAWLPANQIRLNYALYGDNLVGAIKMRAQEAGSVLRVETAIEKAKRVQSRELAHAEREHLLALKGADAARGEHRELRKQLDQKIADVRAHLTTIKLEQGADANSYVIRTDQISLSFYFYPKLPITESLIVVQTFDAPLILPGTFNRMYVGNEAPRPISRQEFHFDYDASYGWCWRSDPRNGDVLSTPELAEHVIKLVLEVHEQFASGEIVRRNWWE